MPKITRKYAKKAGELIGIDFAEIDLSEFVVGLETELEHGSRDPETNITNDDPVLTGRIAWAHLKENSRYYTILTTVGL